MNAKQRRKQREREIALNAWYSCMIAMGSIPKNEDLYLEARKRFLAKHRIGNGMKVKTTSDKEFSDIKERYNSLRSFQNR